MLDKEHKWDLSLQIKTVGRDDLKADQYHHPYEQGVCFCIQEIRWFQHRLRLAQFLLLSIYLKMTACLSILRLYDSRGERISK